MRCFKLKHVRKAPPRLTHRKFTILGSLIQKRGVALPKHRTHILVYNKAWRYGAAGYKHIYVYSMFVHIWMWAAASVGETAQKRRRNRDVFKSHIRTRFAMFRESRVLTVADRFVAVSLVSVGLRCRGLNAVSRVGCVVPPSYTRYIPRDLHTVAIHPTTEKTHKNQVSSYCFHCEHFW